ncbi:hypothetical protein ACMYSQ_006254 [Aspergillus niger]
MARCCSKTLPEQKFYRTFHISRLDTVLTRAVSNNAMCIKYWKTAEAYYTPQIWDPIGFGYFGVTVFSILKFAAGYSALPEQALDMPY